MTIYYKSTGPNGESSIGPGKWHLPQGDQPGAWRIAHGPLSLCNNGIHACRREDLIWWLGERIFTFELAGNELIESNNKVLNRKGRLLTELEAWNDDTARAWVDDCRREFEFSSIDWSVTWSATRLAARLATPSARRWARLSATRWELRLETQWSTNRLFDYLEGRVN